MAESTTRPDVPDELIDLAMTGAKPGCRDDAAFYLRNVVAEIGRRVREQVAREIEANPMNECSGAVMECARIARGES